MKNKDNLGENNLHSVFAFILGMDGVGFDFGVAWQRNAIILLRKKIPNCQRGHPYQ